MPGVYLAVVSLLTLGVWGFDKFRAISRGWRVPEHWLFILILIGGSFGALAGMLFFRHKTRKPFFWIAVGGGCVFYSLALIYIS